MPRDKTASHEKIVAAAKGEFMEYGYKDASMRRIADRVGMTAAGLYRHFDSKEAMFDTLVKPAYDDMMKWLDGHFTRAMSSIDHEPSDLWSDTWVSMMKELVYPRMAEYHLLFAKSKDTRYETLLHDMVADAQLHMSEAADELKQVGIFAKQVPEQSMHLLLSAYATALFEPVMHLYTQEEALKSLETVETFFMPGWKTIMGF